MKRVDPYFVLGVAVPLALVGAYFAWQSIDFDPDQVSTVVTDSLSKMQLAHRKGSAGRPVVVAELSDYECPGCAAQHEYISSFVQKHIEDENVSYVAYDLILPIHEKGVVAALHANCVEKQSEDAYWHFRNRIFKEQSQWAESPKPTKVLQNLIDTTEVDMTELRSCVARSNQMRTDLENVFDVAYKKGGIDHVPVLSVNGEIIVEKEKPKLLSVLRAKVEADLSEVQ